MLQRVLNVSENLHVRVLGSMLRLGRKYHIAHLENKALQVLHHDYPTTLQDWDSFPARRQIKLGDEPDFQTTVEVISIAHEFHLCTILPAAYARYIGQVKLLVAWSLCLKNTLISNAFPLTRNSWRMMVVYQRKLVNVASLAMHGFWNSSRISTLMHFVHRSFHRRHALAKASAKPRNGKRSKAFRYGQPRNHLALAYSI